MGRYGDALSALSLTVWAVHRSLNVKWAGEEGLPEISKLIKQDKIGAAYSLAVQAERYVPNDPPFAKLWQQLSWSESITTVPPGASVFRRNYNAPNEPWEFVGQTPIEKYRFPLVDSPRKFELKGYTTVERATFPSLLLTPPSVTLDEETKARSGMVRVELATAKSKNLQVGLLGCPVESCPAHNAVVSPERSRIQ